MTPNARQQAYFTNSEQKHTQNSVVMRATMYIRRPREVWLEHKHPCQAKSDSLYIIRECCRHQQPAGCPTPPRQHIAPVLQHVAPVAPSDCRWTRQSRAHRQPDMATTVRTQAITTCPPRSGEQKNILKNIRFQQQNIKLQ